MRKTGHTAALLVDAREGRDGAFESLIKACRPLVEHHARTYAWVDRDIDDIARRKIFCITHVGTRLLNTWNDAG